MLPNSCRGKVAKKFPDVKFEHATGYQLADNVTTYNAKFHEGRYVIGQIAAKMSKSGTAGYIVSFPIPEVVSGINAFMLGAQSVNPDFKIKIVWVNSWYDPGKEADAAKVLMGQGQGPVNMQRTQYYPGHHEAPHSHPEDEILYILEGKIHFGRDHVRTRPRRFRQHVAGVRHDAAVLHHLEVLAAQPCELVGAVEEDLHQLGVRLPHDDRRARLDDAVVPEVVPLLLGHLRRGHRGVGLEGGLGDLVLVVDLDVVVAIAVVVAVAGRGAKAG